MMVTESKKMEGTRIPLSPGWRWVRLGEVCKQDKQIIAKGDKIGNLPYVGLENIESNTGRIIIDSLIADSEVKSTTFAFDKRHVLYGKLRPYLNKVALPNFQGCCTTELIPLLVEPGISREFIAWILRRGDTVEAAMREKTGSRMPRANMDALLTIFVPLPFTLAKQERIAGVLNRQIAAVEKARAAAEARLEAATALPAAYLRAFFENTEAKGWSRSRCADHVDVRDGTHDTPTYISNGIPLVTSKNLKPYGIDFDGALMISREDYEQIKKRSGVNVGDILFAMIGTIGNPVIVDTNKEFSIKNVALFKFDNSPLEKEFFYFVLRSPDVIEQIRIATRGGIQKFVSLAVLRNLQIPIPSLQEQKVFVAKLREKLSMTNMSIRNNEEQLQTINALPAALLRRAFTGGL